MCGLCRTFFFLEKSNEARLKIIKNFSLLFFIRSFKILVYGISIFVFLSLILIFIGYSNKYGYQLFHGDLSNFIGINEYVDSQQKVISPPKTLWDFLQIIIIPGILALGVSFLEHSAKERESFLVEENSKDSKYNDYLKTMGDLILKREAFRFKNKISSSCISTSSHKRCC